jgi:WXXGXW repeat (2 copies)
MKSFMRFTLFAAVLLLGSYGTSAQIGVGIRIGPPPPPRVVVEPPASPGPDFIWVDGYWYPAHGHYRWHEGYWTRALYPGARWIGPRHEGGLYFNGYWEGDRGRFEHRHEWDRDRARDHDRYREHQDHHDDHH